MQNNLAKSVIMVKNRAAQIVIALIEGTPVDLIQIFKPSASQENVEMVRRRAHSNVTQEIQQTQSVSIAILLKDISVLKITGCRHARGSVVIK